jgi:type II secretory pathway component PulF
MGCYVNFVLTRVVPAVGAVVFLWLAWRAVWALPPARPLRDRLALVIPVARGYELRAAALRLFRALHSLLRAGLTAGEALAIAADATGNGVLAGRVRGAAEALRRGASVEEVTTGLHFLSPQQRATLTTAFQSGRLEEGLARLAEEARDQTAMKLWQARLAVVGTGIVLVTVVAVAALIVGWLNLYAAMAERAGVADIWQELRQ